VSTFGNDRIADINCPGQAMTRDTHEAAAAGQSILVLLCLKYMTPRIHTQ
jgi:hypothetical protein